SRKAAKPPGLRQGVAAGKDLRQKNGVNNIERIDLPTSHLFDSNPSSLLCGFVQLCSDSSDKRLLAVPLNGHGCDRAAPERSSRQGRQGGERTQLPSSRP